MGWHGGGAVESRWQRCVRERHVFSPGLRQRALIDVDITQRRVELRFDDIDLCKPLGFASYATLAGLRKIEYRRLAVEMQR